MRRYFWAGIILVATIGAAVARDYGQWENVDPEVKEWFSHLMQPDNPNASCCGEADAYWCDDIHIKNDKTYCTVDDPRVIPGRTPIPAGTEVLIPNNKLKWDKGNPTGHSIVFLSSGGTMVYCFVQNTGT